MSEGWRNLKLGDVCTDNREMVSPESLEPDTPYIGLEHMPRRSISLSDWGTAEQVTSSKLRFNTGDFAEIIISSITDQLRNLPFQNQKLRTARDLLLPKLMSGEIEV